MSRKERRHHGETWAGDAWSWYPGSAEGDSGLGGQRARVLACSVLRMLGDSGLGMVWDSDLGVLGISDLGRLGVSRLVMLGASGLGC